VTLLSYQPGKVSGAMSRGTLLRYRDLGVNLDEWRAIALLGASGTANLAELARRAGLWIRLKSAELLRLS